MTTTVEKKTAIKTAVKPATKPIPKKTKPKKEDKLVPPVENKTSLFSGMLATLKKRKDSDYVLVGKNTKLEVLPTGSTVFDLLTGVGGIPKGRFTIIYAEPSAGKSTLILAACATTVKNGGTVVYMDYEATTTYDYAIACGVPASAVEVTFLIVHPPSIREGSAVMEEAIKAKVDLIVVDTVAEMKPPLEVDSKTKKVNLEGSKALGVQARAVQEHLSAISQFIKITGNQTAVVLLNQVRARIVTDSNQARKEKYQGRDKETHNMPGGWYPKHLATLIIRLEKVKAIKGADTSSITNKVEDLLVENQVRLLVMKNKIGKPHRFADFFITFGSGIDDYKSTFELLKSYGIVRVAGAGFVYYTNTEGDEIVTRGTENFLEKLRTDDSLYSLLRTQLLSQMSHIEMGDATTLDGFMDDVAALESSSKPSNLTLEDIPE